MAVGNKMGRTGNLSRKSFQEQKAEYLDQIDG